MGSTERPLQLLDPLLLLGTGPRGCASPPKRSLGSRFHFVFPAVMQVGSNLVLAAGLSNVAALQTFQNYLPLHFRVQFYWGALHILLIVAVISLIMHFVRGRTTSA